MNVNLGLFGVGYGYGYGSGYGYGDGDGDGDGYGYGKSNSLPISNQDELISEMLFVRSRCCVQTLKRTSKLWTQKPSN